MTDTPEDREYMRAAVRLAVRGIGHVEPNPPVGCVIVRDGSVVGRGHHRRFGGPHAEVDALAGAGSAARGATVYVTLEPCRHFGKTPPCTQALIDAGVARVVIGRNDPHADSGGGSEVLRQAGIAVHHLSDCSHARSLSEPFVTRVTQGRPWVIAKWAQTIDGRIATRTGESQWISGSLSRRAVHRWRGRVDAILTGIGTVLADDPMLTARGGSVRRVAKRIVIDSELQIPVDRKLIATAGDVPTVLAVGSAAVAEQADLAAALQQQGVHLIQAKQRGDRLDLRDVLQHLAREHEATRVLVEAGPGLLGALAEEDLIDEARVFVAPMIMGDADALPAIQGLETAALADCQRFELIGAKRFGPDVLLNYFRTP